MAKHNSAVRTPPKQWRRTTLSFTVLSCRGMYAGRFSGMLKCIRNTEAGSWCVCFIQEKQSHLPKLLYKCERQTELFVVLFQRHETGADQELNAWKIQLTYYFHFAATDKQEYSCRIFSVILVGFASLITLKPASPTCSFTPQRILRQIRTKQLLIAFWVIFPSRMRLLRVDHKSCLCFCVHELNLATRAVRTKQKEDLWQFQWKTRSSAVRPHGTWVRCLIWWKPPHPNDTKNTKCPLNWTPSPPCNLSNARTTKPLLHIVAQGSWSHTTQTSQVASNRGGSCLLFCVQHKDQGNCCGTQLQKILMCKFCIPALIMRWDLFVTCLHSKTSRKQEVKLAAIQFCCAFNKHIRYPTFWRQLIGRTLLALQMHSFWGWLRCFHNVLFCKVLHLWLFSHFKLWSLHHIWALFLVSRLQQHLASSQKNWGH